MKRYIYTIMMSMLLVMITPLLWGQINENPFFSPYLSSEGLLNMNNLQMNHTLSFSSGFSSSGDGFYQSVYTNHILYKFNPKLDLNINLNFVNHGTANWDNDFSVSSNNDNTSGIVPEFSLNYRPSKNSRITIEYRQYSNQYQNNQWRW